MTNLKERTALVKKRSIAVNKAQAEMTNAFTELLDATFDFAYAVGFGHGKLEKQCEDGAGSIPESSEEEVNDQEGIDTVEPTPAD